MWRSALCVRSWPVLSNSARCLPKLTTVNNYSADAAPEKIEVFVDDQKVLVDPGTTILQ
ncbi:Hypothetical predicted protein, partial [Paramuricea clavata]